MFLELLEEAYTELDEIDDLVFEFFLNSCDGSLDKLQEELELSDEDIEVIAEQLKKRVSAKGQVTRVKSREIRKRRAVQTTGMSRAELKRRARKTTRTKKRNPSSVKRAVRKRKKAMRRRKQMGIK